METARAALARRNMAPVTHTNPTQPLLSPPLAQREKKTLKPILQDGKPVALTSHTLAPVPFAIGGSGLPAEVVLRDDMPEVGALPISPSIFLLFFRTMKNMKHTLAHCGAGLPAEVVLRNSRFGRVAFAPHINGGGPVDLLACGAGERV